jgi:hypothetical protein
MHDHDMAQIYHILSIQYQQKYFILFHNLFDYHQRRLLFTVLLYIVD